MTEMNCKYSRRSRSGCAESVGVRARVSSTEASAAWSEFAFGRLLATGMDCNDVDGRVLPVEGDS